MHGIMPIIAGDVAGSTPTADTAGGLSNLFDTGLQVADFAFDLFDLMIAHPVLSIFIAVGLISLAAGLIGRFAGVSKSVG